MNKQELAQFQYQVGDVVRTKEGFGPNAAGCIGVVYETYADTDNQTPSIISVILTNGHDIGGFTAAEQAESLVRLGTVDLHYTFVSPGQLMADYRRDYFQAVFKEALAIFEQEKLAVAES